MVEARGVLSDTTSDVVNGLHAESNILDVC
jgi:hypothetical protein